MTDAVDLSALAGHEEAASDFGRQDVAMPYLRIVQALSPIMRRGDPKYNSEAREGQIHNTVTGRLTEGVEVIPVKYIRRCTEWKPNRGGFVRDHGTSVEVFENLPDTGSPVRINSAGNEVHISAMYFVMDMTSDARSGALMDFSGVHMKQARRWNGLLMSQEGIIGGVRKKLPLYARSWRLLTIPESNDKGRWMTWQFQEGPFITSLPDASDLIQSCVQFRIAAQQMSLPPITSDDEPARRLPAGGQPGGPAADDDVPF